MADNPTLGSENPILDFIKSKLMARHAPVARDLNDVDTVEKFESQPKEPAPTPTPKMASGGDISAALAQLSGNQAPPIGPSSFDVNTGDTMALPMQGTQPGMPTMLPPNPTPVSSPATIQAMHSAPPPVTVNHQPSTMSSLSAKAPTLNQPAAPEPSIYEGISADDRAALTQQLLGQKASPGNLAVSGAAGIGDAITSSFGRQPTHFQENVRATQDKNIDQRLSAVDTQRTQRVQDLQASVAQQEQDPASPYSVGMRQFLSQLTGKQFPSGISAAMMKSFFSDYAKIFDSQLTASTAAGQQGVEAGKELANQGFWHQLGQKILGTSAKASDEGTKYLEKRVGASGGDAQPSSGGSKHQVPGYNVAYRVTH